MPEPIVSPWYKPRTVRFKDGTVVSPPDEERAEEAVLAWMRHQTTAYDDVKIARVKGRRRKVRRELAKRSRELLHQYRAGEEPDPQCPLRRVFDSDGDEA